MNVFNEIISRFIIAISEVASNFWQNFTLIKISPWQVAVDILLIAILFYWLIRLVRGTRAVNILLGLFVLLCVLFASKAFDLLALNWLLGRLLTVLLVAIPIIFQQELRRGLEKLGKTKFFLAQEAKEIDFLKSELISACYEMANKKIGALIVLKKEVSLKEYIDTGISLMAKVSKELLLSIFSPLSPLHDGAVIIDKGKIVAASCVLPHTFQKMPMTFGTRHKAAISLSEATDAHVIVISEERGIVSFVKEGKIFNDIKEEQFSDFLDETFIKKGAKKKIFKK